MRLWTLHPKYLDAKGLVALWREALLAQAVLRCETRGYLNHPQLIRFRETPTPVRAIACYLQEVHAESLRRGYRFDVSKIPAAAPVEQILATQGQLAYEWLLFREKLRRRAPFWLAGLTGVEFPDPHPLFRIVAGPVASWERVKD